MCVVCTRARGKMQEQWATTPCTSTHVLSTSEINETTSEKTKTISEINTTTSERNNPFFILHPGIGEWGQTGGEDTLTADLSNHFLFFDGCSGTYSKILRTFAG